MNVAVPTLELLQEVAAEKAIDPAFVEKDWWVTQLIEWLTRFVYPGVQLIFSGGTALSKAHRLLERFSEDVDFRVLYPALSSAESQTEQRRMRSDLKRALTDHIHARFPIDPAAVTARNANRFFAFDLQYPSQFEPAAALRPHIQVEFTLSELRLAAVSCHLTSFVREVTQQAPEVASIACLDPVENAADKLSAYLWRVAARNRSDPHDDPSIVRHQHDLAILYPLAIAHPRFRALVLEAICQDADRFPLFQGVPLSDQAAIVVEKLQSDARYPAEYDQFVRGMSYARTEHMPTFPVSLARVQALLEHVT